MMCKGSERRETVAPQQIIHLLSLHLSLQCTEVCTNLRLGIFYLVSIGCEKQVIIGYQYLQKKKKYIVHPV